MKSSKAMVLGKRKSPLPQRPIPNTNSKSKTKTAETNIAGGTHTGGTLREPLMPIRRFYVRDYPAAPCRPPPFQQHLPSWNSLSMSIRDSWLPAVH